MKKLKSILFIIVVVAFYSCGNNEPTTHNSISGLWRCAESPTLGMSRVFIVDIERNRNDTTQFQLFNFYNIDASESVAAHLKGTSLSIALQQIGNTATPVIVRSGSGVVSLNFTRIDFSYDIYDGLNDIKVNAVYTRE